VFLRRSIYTVSVPTLGV